MTTTWPNKGTDRKPRMGESSIPRHSLRCIRRSTPNPVALDTPETHRYGLDIEEAKRRTRAEQDRLV